MKKKEQLNEEKISEKPAKKVTRAKKIAPKISDAELAESIITAISKKRKDKATQIQRSNKIENPSLPIPHMALEYLLDRRGLAANMLMEIVGEEGKGKSSLMYTIMGHIAHTTGAYCVYLNSEAKRLETRWLKRLVHPSDKVAEKLLENFIFFEDDITSLVDMDTRIREDLASIREVAGFNTNIPILVVIDALAKIKNNSEAEGMALFTEKGAAKTATGVEYVGQQPGVTAKWLHTWTRGLPELLKAYNCTIAVVNGQNEKMSMGSPAAGKLASYKNDTATGGRAVRQSAAVRITMGYKGMLRESSAEVGKIIQAYCKKNSYGAESRSISYYLRDKNFTDEDTPSGRINGQALEFDEEFCTLLVTEAKSMLGITLEKKKFTWRTKGIESVTAKELYAFIVSDETIRNEVGAALRISGYIDEFGNTINNIDDSEDTSECEIEEDENVTNNIWENGDSE